MTHLKSDNEMMFASFLQMKMHPYIRWFHTCSSRSRISLMMVPVSSMVWMSWVQFWGHKKKKS